MAVSPASIVGSTTQEGNMTHETNRLIDLFKTTRTICAGRFILDVPAESDVIYGPARLPYMVERRRGVGGQLNELVEERRREIMTDDSPRARGPLKKSDSMFGKVVSGAAPDQWLLFGAGKATGSFYSIESLQRVGQDLYVQKTAAYGDAYREVIQKLNLIASNLLPRGDEEVPIEPGICFDGAFVKEPSSPIYEAVTLGVRLRQLPDVHFSIEWIKKQRRVDADSLEARIEDAAKIANSSGALAWYKQVKVLRRGKRTIGGWKGYEYLARKPARDQVMDSHEFAYFSHGEANNPLLPTMDVALDTGVRGNKANAVHPSITDEEALYLWDKLLSSIRPRPVGNPSAE
jgi:hypothetical protein